MNLLIVQAQILNNLLSLIKIFWQLSIWRKKIKQKLQYHGKWFVSPTIKTLYVVQMHNDKQFVKMLTTFITRLISIFKQFHKPKCIFIRNFCGTFCGLLHNRDFFHWPRCHILYGEHVSNRSRRSAYSIRFSWTWLLGISEEVCADDDFPLKTQGL